MFTKVILDYKDNLFSELSEITKFEDITKGRDGAVLVDTENSLIPLVRTTTKYIRPPQRFQSIHYDIMEKINEKVKETINLDDIHFNNALIEVYDCKYHKMGFHSDQALDLAEDSYIAIYSCYENVQNVKRSSLRKLIIKNKETDKSSEIIMEHNSVIIFSLQTNRQHLHKIILENINENNRWLGITFRLSKTFINHIDNTPFIYNTDNILTLANKEETIKFYKLRGEENKSLDFKYPEFNYTISVSDTLPID